ncbi:diacylglycerol kinase family protein [Paenibacillus herberti]|uniref:Diacylglycerol kinase n=1 Tax=Paenibacillus herberti TaxID=1619309 RepID=A0A229P0H8_9BACL|nr:diacylglycerol kinase family protein [Paenibacillus herberti]OXM15618.1 diacylglycerol kinase [Paenibacillus herberti]
MGFMRSLSLAWSGILHALRTERHMKVHLVAAVAMTALAATLDLSSLEWAALVFAMGLVFTAELVNTAIERAVDLASSGERHPLAKQAKDASAGAVLVCAVVAVIIGFIVLGPPLWRLLTT